MAAPAAQAPDPDDPDDPDDALDPDDPDDALARQLDGAVSDWTVSGDAMRWSPERADSPDEPPPPSAFPGVDVAAGLGSVLGLDGPAVRRLVAAAVSSLGMVAGEMVDEVRGWGSRRSRHDPG